MKTLEQVLADAEPWDRAVRSQLSAPRDPWFAVYALFDLRDPRRTRYIGVSRSVSRRYAEHVTRPGYRLAPWVRALRDAGAPLGLRVLRRYARGVDAFAAEARLVGLQLAVGGCDLNSTHASFMWAMEKPAGFSGWPEPPSWALEVVS